MTQVGAVNGWVCEECGKATVAVHVDDGVTPMFMTCRSTPGCAGRAVSTMYPDQVPQWMSESVLWEFYRPTVRWARRKGRDVLAHVLQGGLVIRELTDAGRRALGQAS